MKKGRKEMWRGDERFLKDPKNDGNGGGSRRFGGRVQYWNCELNGTGLD